MPYHDCSLKTIVLPNDNDTIYTIWGVAIGNSLLSYFCAYCNIIWKANFPRKKMIRIAKDASNFPCPGCVQKTLKKVGNETVL